MQKRLIRALKGEATMQVPFWLMRQAGRYLPEYRELRKQAGGFLDLCFNPELATEVTLQPLRRFDMDAAILFSDILVVPYALGQELSFAEGEGPVLGACNVTSVERDAFLARLAPVYETVRRVRAALPDDKALIGFAGAPWTVACYMVQGRGDGGVFTEAKKFAFSNPEEMDRIIGLLVEATALHLCAQIRAGADVVQIFDSWAGLLPAEYFNRWVVEPTQQIVAAVRAQHPDTPIIGFPRGAGEFMQRYAENTGVHAVGVDQSVVLSDALRHGLTVQGNLAPEILLEGGQRMEKEIKRILAEIGDAPFIFNLGHGVIKETPPEHVQKLSEIIRAWRR